MIEDGTLAELPELLLSLLLSPQPAINPKTPSKTATNASGFSFDMYSSCSIDDCSATYPLSSRMCERSRGVVA